MLKYLLSNALLILVFVLPNWSTAQNVQTIPVQVEVTQAELIGVTPPIRTLVPMPSMSAEKRKRAKQRRKAPNNFAGRGKYVSTVENPQPQGPDPLRQYGFGRMDGIIIVEPLVNIEGLSSGFAPHDPSGDIGTDHYLQAINATRLGVFDKDGALQNSFAANTIWNTIGFSSAGDPIILFDQETSRWIITEFPPSNQLLFAISEGSDPMGSYTVYNFATPNFPDYPKFSVWDNAYVVTTNEQGPVVSPAYFIDRADVLAGAATVDIQRLTLPGAPSGPGFQVDTPVDWSGLTPPQPGANPMVLSLDDDAWGNSTDDGLDIYSFEVDFDNPGNTVTTVQNLKMSPFDTNPCSAAGPGFACMPQMNGTGLDGIPETIMNQVHYRNFGTHEAMVFNFITDVTAGQNLSGIRWVELRRIPGETDWTIHQEGTFAPDDGLDRFMGGIAMDGSGNIALAYNVTSPESFVGVRFTGRIASDPLGQMTVQEFNAVEGENRINSNGRFGDYGHMSIDPVDDRTFWYTTEYAGGGNATTRIISFEIRRDTIDIGPVALLTPQSQSLLTATEPVTIEVRNLGLDTQSVFKIGYIFENGTAISEDIDFDLFPDSSYRHTFTNTVDMSAIGSYNFTIFTELEGDQAPLNDTLRRVVSHLPRFDAGITEIDLRDFTCETNLDFMATISNFGTVPLTTVDVLVSVNGTVVETINWEGNLDITESEAIAISITDFIEGGNAIQITTANPNGETDEEMTNDGRTETLNFIVDGEMITLNLLLDDFPEEVTWQLLDASEAIIFSGGPYMIDGELISETWCLDPDGCYTFNIIDAYGDGICCAEGQGNYEILNSEGIIMANSNGQYGAGDMADFCATFACTLSSSVITSNENGIGNNGAILISASSGTTPYQYSIDGGATFSNITLYQGLSAGTYLVVVMDVNDCLSEETVIINNCQIDILAEIGHISSVGATDGSINIVLESGGAAPFSYSIDNGNSFQDSPVFENLPMGDYVVVVRDANECQVNQLVSISVAVSTSTELAGQLIEILPNPTNGIFRINVTGLERTSVFLPLEIYNAEGKLLYESTITRYDGVYTGQVSILMYPAGVYYVRLKDEAIGKLLQIVKL